MYRRNPNCCGQERGKCNKCDCVELVVERRGPFGRSGFLISVMYASESFTSNFCFCNFFRIGMLDGF
jgi:hypothetical protein